MTTGCDAKLNRWAAWALGILVLTALATAAWRNVGNQDLWFDEAGQVWMAMGLGHWSDPLMPRGSLAEAMSSNAKHNLDPGGYTALLHVVTGLGQSATLLRSVSFAFFIVLCIGCGLVALRLGGGPHLAIAACGLPLLSPLLFRHAFEIRAYGIEAACVVATAALLAASTLPGRRTYALLGVLTGLAIWSRYSAVVDLAPACLVMTLVAFQAEPKREAALRITLLALPVLLSAVVVWATMLRLQNPGGTPPDYIHAYLLAGAEPAAAIGLILRNVLGTPGVAIIALLIAIAVTRGVSQPAGLRLCMVRIALAALGAQMLFMILSFAGKHPWDLSERWSIGLVAWSLACSVATMALCWATFPQMTAWRRWVLLACAAVPVTIMHSKAPVTTGMIAAFACAVAAWAPLARLHGLMHQRGAQVILVLCAAFCVHVAARSRYDAWDGTASLVQRLGRQGDLNLRGMIACDPNVTPCARYQFEFGALQGERAVLYPQRMRLMQFWTQGQADDCVALISRRGPSEISSLLGPEWSDSWIRSAEFQYTHLYVRRSPVGAAQP